MAASDALARFRLEGRVAVVTGASSGIGAGLAEALAGAGAHLVLAARREEALQALAKRLGESHGVETLVVPCDVARDADLERLVEAARARFERMDVLVNNAGINEIVPAEDESEETWRRVLDVNLTGAFLCAQRVGREMLAAGSGSIVNVASVLGLVASAQIKQASYVASKAGLVGLTRELAGQWARRGVRVNALAPGWFETEMTAEMFGDERSLRWIRSRDPMGRAGRVDELAGPLLFLASDASSYVTGQVLAVDGGWTIV
jgi:NAD(P)-dependent dehydrogenase (short-subunit alcohol dehydrogenase family)